MTNSELLQYIIQELNSSPVTWEGDKALFELLFAPLSYGNDIYQNRKAAKKGIIDIFKNSETFDQERFEKLSENIVCGENEQRHRKDISDFLNLELKRLDLNTDADINAMVEKIPCKTEGEQNYKNNFSNWKQKKMRINKPIAKKRLEQNFDFSSSLWDKGDLAIQENLKKGIEKFISRHSKVIPDKFEQMRKEFGMQDRLTKQEEKDLQAIQSMDQAGVMAYIAKYYPLNKKRSQEFIVNLVPILYNKGYYVLLLEDIIEALDLHIQATNDIQKIKAHILGSSEIGEYKKAFDILDTITSVNDDEVTDMHTEAISNMRRYQLSDSEIEAGQKKEIISILISHYEEVFNRNKTYHYYPGINLAYMLKVLVHNKDNVTDTSNLKRQINEIYQKAKNTIAIDKNSDDLSSRYYAHITEIEFLLLRDIGNPIAELERYLELESDMVSFVELERTSRQMQFFIDSTANLPTVNHSVMKMQDAIGVIDDFIDYKNGYHDTQTDQAESAMD